MGQGFDPYYVWLGIPPHEQPPDHYRLLGIALCESQPDVIATAADRQMGHLRTFQTGKHSDLSQRLLNEVAAARVCLLNPAKKVAYDAQLQVACSAAVQTVASSITSSNEPHLAPPPIQPPPLPRLPVAPAAPVSTSIAARVRRGKHNQNRRFLRGTFSLVQIIVGGVIGLAAACFILSVMYPEHPIVVGVREFFHPASPTKNPLDEPPDLPLRKPPDRLRNPDIDRQTAMLTQPEPRPILLEPPKQLTVDLGTGVKLEMVLIPAGEFMMGSGEPAQATAEAFKRYNSKINAKSFDHEHPQHRVQITRPFCLGRYEVTVGQFRRFVSQTGYRTDAEKDGKGAYGTDTAGKLEQKPEYTWRNPGFPQTDEHPVVNVSWNDATAFCEWLSREEGKNYRLPTESEWEYACRAGTTTRYCHGDDPESLYQMGNVADAVARAKFSLFTWTIAGNDGYVFTAPVGRFPPNEFGLYDMHGNVWEMCSDWYANDYYSASPATDPQGPLSGKKRVFRGGAWYLGPTDCPSQSRGCATPAHAVNDYGFRVAMNASRPDTKLPPSPASANAAKEKLPEITPIVPTKLPDGTRADNGDPQPRPRPILLEPPKQLTVDLGTGVKLEMVLIPAGEFMMGSGEPAEATAEAFKRYNSKIDAKSFEHEHPQHQVQITRPFYLGRYEVTVGQFRQFISQSGYRTDAEKDGKGGRGIAASGKFEQKPEYTWRNPGFPQTDEQPAVNVSWSDATAFCEWLSRDEGKTYRLPTEAEWEYACRAGTTTLYYNGDDPEPLYQIGNVADAAFKTKFPGSTWTIAGIDGYTFAAPIGQFPGNGFGLYDMHGNVWEWCSDWYAVAYYGSCSEVATDPQGPPSGKGHVLRGGSWCDWLEDLRSANRKWYSPPVSRASFLGFRVAMTLLPANSDSPPMMPLNQQAQETPGPGDRGNPPADDSNVTGPASPPPPAPTLEPKDFDEFTLPTGRALTRTDWDVPRDWPTRCFPDDANPCPDRFPNGAIRGVYSFTDHGTLHGWCAGLDENGKLRALADYYQGRRDGPLRVWDDSRHLHLYAEYTRGNNSGVTCLFRDGNPWLVQEWDKGKRIDEYLITTETGGPTAVATKDLSIQQAGEAAEAQAKFSEVQVAMEEGENELKRRIRDWWTEESERIKRETINRKHGIKPAPQPNQKAIRDAWRRALGQAGP